MLMVVNELSVSVDDAPWRECHTITRAEADALIDALSVRDASGRLIAPPQSQPAERPAGPWDANTKP